MKNLNGSEAIPKYMFLVSYAGKKDAFKAYFGIRACHWEKILADILLGYHSL
jgi:hypothetical protein